MESCSTPLLVLLQSKLVENTTKYIQNRLDSDKCSRDWICPQSLVSALAPTKFYKSQNQYLPTDNIPQLEADASLLDISNKGRASIPLKNLEAWERKARKLVSINSHISYIIGFLINMQVQGQHPHQWAPFQIAGLLHAWQISHQISRYVYHEG